MTASSINHRHDPIHPDVADFYEESDSDIRRTLGLRPTVYSTEPNKGTHPDQRPCPSWCWVGQHEEYDHEFDPATPMQALHVMEGYARTVATLYKGPKLRSSSSGYETAAFVTQLRARGQGNPYLKVWLEFEAGQRDVAVLSLTDAEELARVLLHMVDVAEGGRR